MLKTIDDKNFKVKDYIDALERLESYIEMMTYSFGFTNEEINLKDLKKDYRSDIRAIRLILKRTRFKKTLKRNEKVNNKRTRISKRKIKLKRLYNETKDFYPLVVIKKENKCFIRVYNTSKSKGFYKRLSNKLVRRTSNKFLKSFGTYTICKGAYYKRLLDSYFI